MTKEGSINKSLVFIVPLADKVSQRKIVSLNMSIAVVCCLAIALTHSIWVVWAASIILVERNLSNKSEKKLTVEQIFVVVNLHEGMEQGTD